MTSVSGKSVAFDVCGFHCDVLRIDGVVVGKGVLVQCNGEGCNRHCCFGEGGGNDSLAGCGVEITDHFEWLLM